MGLGSPFRVDIATCDKRLHDNRGTAFLDNKTKDFCLVFFFNRSTHSFGKGRIKAAQAFMVFSVLGIVEDFILAYGISGSIGFCP